MAPHALRRIGYAVLVLAGFLSMTRAATASPSARLVFARGADTDACPDEQGFRAAVAQRVGYDPFFPYAKRTLVTRIDPVAGGRFRARMEVLDDKGSLVGEKSFVSAGRDCEELVRTLALAVSLAIDVVDAPSTTAEPEPSPEPAAPAAQASAQTSGPSMPDSTAAPEPPIVPTPSDDESRLRVELSATARGSIGLAPSPNLGVAVGAALRRRPWSLGIEGRYDHPAAGDVGSSTSLSIGLLAGSLVPCASWRWLFGCALATLGRVSAQSSGIQNPASDDALFVALGGRVGAEVEATPALAFRAALDVAAAPISHGVSVGLREVYSTSSVFGSLGASAVVHF